MKTTEQLERASKKYRVITSQTSLIKNNVLLLAATLLLTACSSMTFQSGNPVKDKDWNTRFRSNCPLPHYDSIRWVSENNQRFARFTLSNGDKGGCINDKVARHSAMYWERAELRQDGMLRKGRAYTIDARLRFVEGFSGEKETFFQVHAYNRNCKQAYPPIMIKFDNAFTDTAVITLRALQDSRRSNSYRSAIHIDDVLGDWMNMKVELDTIRENTVTVSIDGETVFSAIPFYIEPCGNLHIKFGAYRPGRVSGNVKSVVDYDSINVN